MGRGRETIRVTWASVALVAALVVATPAAARAFAQPAALASLRESATTASAPAIAPTATFTDDRSLLRRARFVPNAVEPRPALLVRAIRNLSVRARPTAAADAIGVIPAGSKYYDVPITAWVERLSSNGRWGRVEIPYVSPRRDGWIKLAGLERSKTSIAVDVDLSTHVLTVTKAGRKLFSFAAATGAPSTPTPAGEYFVTDRIPFSPGGPLGSFAFGISGIQPHLPSGWSGGNQLAIHGTSNPATIGHSVSAGCVRVSEVALRSLLPLLQLGTPVVIHP